MKFFYVLVIVHFTAGQGSDLPAYISAVFDDLASCCEAVNAFKKRKVSRQVIFCVTAAQEMDYGTFRDMPLPRVTDCED